MSRGPKENEISGEIVDAALHVYKALGPGLLESVYETVLAYELAQRGHQVERQVPISICYENLVFDAGFKADLLVDGLVLVELKSVENLAPVHKKQTLTYVRLANKRLGLLLNFGAARMIDGISTSCMACLTTGRRPVPRLCGSAALREISSRKTSKCRAGEVRYLTGMDRQFRPAVLVQQGGHHHPACQGTRRPLPRGPGTPLPLEIGRASCRERV